MAFNNFVLNAIAMGPARGPPPLVRARAIGDPFAEMRGDDPLQYVLEEFDHPFPHRVFWVGKIQNDGVVERWKVIHRPEHPEPIVAIRLEE